MVSHTYDPRCVGGIGRRISVQGQPTPQGWGDETLPKTKLKQKKANGVVQVAEQLPSKFETLSSDPSTTR
jgi:hypothetical protein